MQNDAKDIKNFLLDKRKERKDKGLSAYASYIANKIISNNSKVWK